MILFTTDTPWEAARRSVRFTASALGATTLHASMAKTPRALLKKWNEIDEARRDADDALVDANAKVAALDGDLDDLVLDLANEILHEAKQDRSDAQYVAYFPDAPSEIARLGLESEIERTKKFFVVASEHKPSKAVAAVLAKIKDVQTRGSAALADRVEATAEVAKVSLRVQTWKEDANGARRSIDNALDEYANQNKVSRDYTDRYFPQVGRSSRRTKKSGSPTTGGGTTTGST
jgi:hypothetical protein